MSKQAMWIGALAVALLVSAPLAAQDEALKLARTPWGAPD